MVLRMLLLLTSGLVSLAFNLPIISSFSVRQSPKYVKMSLETVNVDLPDARYPIYIGTDLLQPTKDNLLLKHVTSKKALIVTNTKVGPLYSNAIRKILEGANIETFEVVLPDGEEYKNMDVLMQIIDGAMDAKLDRKSTLIALGGGVVGDMTGFAAAIYQRGVKFVQVPTTLMAMVDSAVGGKTGVNHPSGKNMIGAFYQPQCVLVDTNTLSTLPDRELRSGIAEIIKYGLIKDDVFFEWLENNMQSILERDPKSLAYAVKRSCENKAAVVAADEREAGLRATLNLGHTFGHAIETGLGYGAWLHGEAVSAGTVMAADMSYRLGWIEESVVQRLDRLLRKSHLPINLANNAAENEGGSTYIQMKEALDTDTFLGIMSVDKKVADGKLSLVLLKGKLGECVITNKFDAKVLREVVEDYCQNRK